MSLRNKSILLIILIIVIDQVSKFWIKTNMTLGQDFHIIGNWFIIHFTENNGMAFGLEFWGPFGKLFLSLFRLVAIVVIGYIIYKLIKEKSSTGLVLGVSAIMAGALGNLIDSAFYGLIFNESFTEPAKFLPESGGYAPFLFGRVVDMFYFPIINTTYPSWIPGVGGEPFVFFSPVFNVADTAITSGVFYLLIFQRKVLLAKTEEKKPVQSE